MPFTSWYTATIFEMGSTIAVRSTKAQGLMAKPSELGNRRPEQAEQGAKRQKGCPAVGTPGAPSRGPDIHKLHI
jgi:hypothetical protein